MWRDVDTCSEVSTICHMRAPEYGRSQGSPKPARWYESSVLIDKYRDFVPLTTPVLHEAIMDKKLDTHY